jgi:hypothetical protein
MYYGDSVQLKNDFFFNTLFPNGLCDNLKKKKIH